MLDAKQLIANFDAFYKTGVSQMDRVHEEFLHLLVTAANSAEESFHHHMAVLFEHCQLHFFEEEASMAAFQAPEYDHHCREHKAILEVMQGHCDGAAEGRIEHARQWLKQDFIRWFDQHTRSWDSLAAEHVKGRESQSA